MAAITGLLALIFSCGLDVYIYLHPVTYRDFVPSPDPLYNYFSFQTSDSRNHNDAADYFKGFEIYYRIYNNSGTAATDRSQINQYNEDNPYLAYNYIINTKNYRRLLTSERTSTPLITGATTNRQVTVRLVPYVDEVPSMYVDTTYLGVPRRNVDDGIYSDAAILTLKRSMMVIPTCPGVHGMIQTTNNCMYRHTYLHTVTMNHTNSCTVSSFTSVL